MSESTKITESTVRVRLQHSHTLKDGWRLSETTVEWIGGEEINWYAINGAMSDSFAMGAREAEQRNELDKQP